MRPNYHISQLIVGGLQSFPEQPPSGAAPSYDVDPDDETLARRHADL